MGVVLSASHALIPLTNRKAAEAEINIITQKIKIAKSPSYGIFQGYVIAELKFGISELATHPLASIQRI